MTEAEKQALKDELKKEIMEEMKQKKNSQLDEAQLFRKHVTDYCEDIKKKGYDKSKVKEYIYSGVKLYLGLNRIDHLNKANINIAYTAFDYLKVLIERQKVLKPIIVSGVINSETGEIIGLNR